MGQAILVIFWVIGIVLAKGFWSTFFAVIFPLWAYFLVAYRIITAYFPELLS